MKIHLQNTTSGLVPMLDYDYDQKKKLKIGQVYSCEIKQARNYEFHKKYFALINCSWEYLNEKQTAFFGNIRAFRKTVEVSAGHFELAFSLDKKEWLQVPKSIAFGSMSESSFSELYDNAKDVIFGVFLKHIEWEEFEKHLIHF